MMKARLTLIAAFAAMLLARAGDLGLMGFHDGGGF
jgi:hypothetical protein